MTRVTSIVAWVAGALLVVLYLYAAWAAFGNLSGMVALGGALGTGLSFAGWFWLILGLVLPIAALTLALWLGRRRSAWMRVLLIALGLAVVAALQIDIVHLIPESSYFG